MSRNRLLALVAGAALVSGCASSYEASPKQTSDRPVIAAPAPRVYRSGLETRATFSVPTREYGTPNSHVSFELGEDSGQSRQFGFQGVVINGENHRYGSNIFPEDNELSLVLRPDSKEKVIFIDGTALAPGNVARSEIDELYVFTPVLNAEGKLAREFKYSPSDPIYGKKAKFNRPDIKNQARGILYENNTDIVMPDLEPVRIGDTWFFTPFSADGDKSKSPYYLIEASGAISGAERETGAVFLRTDRGIYRGTRMTLEQYNLREERHKQKAQAEKDAAKAKADEEARVKSIQDNNPGIIEIIK